MLNFLCAIQRSCSRHQTLITAGWSESESTQQIRHLWRPGLRNIVNVRTIRLLQNHPRKALCKIKTPLWSAESTSAHISPYDWSRWASAAGRRLRRLRAAATCGITELSERAPPIFGWAAITLGISAHSSCDYNADLYGVGNLSITL